MILENNQPNNHNHDHMHDPIEGHDHMDENKDLIAEAYNLLKSNKPVKALHSGHTDMPFISVREINYKNHDIVIRTTYEIEIDGKILHNHIFVDNEGKVSSHAMPTYSFPSTVDLIKRLIDQFPNSFSLENIAKGDLK